MKLEIEIDAKKIWNGIKKPLYASLGVASLLGTFYLGRISVPEKSYSVTVYRSHADSGLKENELAINMIRIEELFGKKENILYDIGPKTTEEDLRQQASFVREIETIQKGKPQKHFVSVTVNDNMYCKDAKIFYTK